MCGSGITQWGNVNGRKFENIVWYGCSSKVYDASNYWAVDVNTFSGPIVSLRAVSFEVVLLAPTPGKATPPFLRFEVNMDHLFRGITSEENVRKLRL